MARTIEVYLYDKNPDTSLLISAAIIATEGLHLAASSATPEAFAQDLLTETSPWGSATDVIFLNISGSEGIPLLSSIHDTPATQLIPVIVFLDHRDESTISVLQDNFASSIIVCNCGSAPFPETLEAVCNYWAATPHLPIK